MIPLLAYLGAATYTYGSTATTKKPLQILTPVIPLPPILLTVLKATAWTIGEGLPI